MASRSRANATEAALLEAAKRVLAAARRLPLEADFFTDLGGHSLLAARFISVVRADRRHCAGITLQDVYVARAAARDGRTCSTRAGAAPPAARPVLRRRRRCCAASSAAWPRLAVLPFILAA